MNEESVAVSLAAGCLHCGGTTFLKKECPDDDDGPIFKCAACGNEYSLDELVEESSLHVISANPTAASAVSNAADAQEEEEGDMYKVEQLELMLQHETSSHDVHYGANLGHWWGDTKHLTIDAGGLRALIEYYRHHKTVL